FAHVLGPEHVAHQPGAAMQAQAVAVEGGDARGVLAAVLQDGQTVIQRGGDFAPADDADDSAHLLFTPDRARLFRYAQTRSHINNPHQARSAGLIAPFTEGGPRAKSCSE